MEELTTFSNGWLVILWLGALLVTLGIWIWASKKKSLGLIEDAKNHVYRQRQADQHNRKNENKTHG